MSANQGTTGLEQKAIANYDTTIDTSDSVGSFQQEDGTLSLSEIAHQQFTGREHIKHSSGELKKMLAVRTHYINDREWGDYFYNPITSKRWTAKEGLKDRTNVV